MKHSTKHETEGFLNESKGRVKTTIGKIIGDTELEAKGSSEKYRREVSKKIDQIEKVSGR
ncbi:MAG: CsbD family protein [Acidiferrobacterales bacterium]